MLLSAVVPLTGAIMFLRIRGMQVKLLPVTQWGFGEIDLDGVTTVTDEHRFGCIAVYRVSRR
jgi:hypothetical protein